MLVAFHVLCIIWIAVLFWFNTQIAHLASVNSGSRSKLDLICPDSSDHG
jgi:hypothetical protein